MDEILTPEHWYELQGRIRQQYPELSDADLQYHEAIEKDMMQMVEFQLIKTKAIMKELIAGHYPLRPLKLHWHRKNRTRQNVH